MCLYQDLQLIYSIPNHAKITSRPRPRSRLRERIISLLEKSNLDITDICGAITDVKRGKIQGMLRSLMGNNGYRQRVIINSWHKFELLTESKPSKSSSVVSKEILKYLQVRPLNKMQLKEFMPATSTRSINTCLYRLMGRVSGYKEKILLNPGGHYVIKPEYR